MSGFINFKLENGSLVTVSKTAIVYIQENATNSERVHIHLVAGVSHIIQGKYDDIRKQFPKFIDVKLQSEPENKKSSVAVHDYNTSYLEKTPNGTTIFFVERGAGIQVRESYETLSAKFHAI
ncbi:hypothetical protein VQZ80_003474 [Salmonella enterica]|nr:hypothetical protein [Salmonella enterica]EEI9212332.1 hypothetical protein [Salmonella enterica subsp. enterica serovar Carrau]EEJ7412432.1 hypothetical protein [Salmonella enterica subsp. enterica serovar Sandiego]HCM4646362.1 hypothetical protein [Salmonella enterica subsp. enterica serovar Panama]EEK8143082.1 hypothetical protein [Salmonella enterica]